MNTTLYTTAAVSVAAVLTLASCQHKELCYDHSHTARVEVVFDWSKAPDAEPESMDVFFFPADGGNMQRYTFAGKSGGYIDLPAGTYEVLCLNSGSETVQWKDIGSWDSFKVYTRDASLLEGMGIMSSTEPPRAEGAEDEKGALAPDMIWSASLRNVEIIPEDSGKPVTLTPEQSITHFTFQITDAENLDNVKSMSGSLSGLSRGMYISSGTLDHECVTVPFPAGNDGTSVISGEFCGFGHCPDDGVSTLHKFVIYAILHDGSKWYYTYDVTNQVHSAKDQMNIHISLQGLPLPEEIGDGSGLQPGIGDWEEEEVDIVM